MKLCKIFDAQGPFVQFQVTPCRKTLIQVCLHLQNFMSTYYPHLPFLPLIRHHFNSPPIYLSGRNSAVKSSKWSVAIFCSSLGDFAVIWLRGCLLFQVDTFSKSSWWYFLVGCRCFLFLDFWLSVFVLVKISCKNIQYSLAVPDKTRYNKYMY